MEKNNLNKKETNILYKKKEFLIQNKSMTNIKNQKKKIDPSRPFIEQFLAQIDILKSSFKKIFFPDSNSFLIKNIKIALSKMTDISKELASQINQYQNNILYYESKIRKMQGRILTELLNKEILENNIINLTQKEKDYELIKEKTGIIVNNGEVINTNRKDNEIIILRTENSTLKGVIEQYEIKLLQKEKEYAKKNMNLVKEKNELILKINNLNKKFFKRQNSNYSQYNISKPKLNNKKSNEYSNTQVNESNDINNRVNEINYYVDNLNNLNFPEMKMNTISTTHMHTIIHSRKNSNYNRNLKTKYDIGNNKIKEKISSTIVNKTINQSRRYNSNKKINKKKIIIKENLKTDRIKTKSHEHNLSNIDNLYINKNNKISENYSICNRPFKRIVHKKSNSNRINNIPFNTQNNNNDQKDYNNISNKENNRNKNNLVNIKNLILNKGQKNKKNKINLIYKNLLNSHISTSNSNNNSRNLYLRNNTSKLYTFKTYKVPTPKIISNN